MDNFAPNELGSVNVDKTHFGSDSATGMLLSLAAKAGRDVSSLEEILQCVKPHPLLIDFPRVIQGLLNALDAMDLPPVLSLGESDFSVWRDECRWLISNRENPAFVKTLGPWFYRGDLERKRNPIIGQGVRDYALPYALLWHEPSDLESQQDFYRLVGQLLVLDHKRPNERHLIGQRYGAYLELRKLCARQALTFPADLRIWSSSAAFVQSCRLFDAAASIDLLAEYFSPVARLARYLGGEEPPERHGGSGHRRRGVAHGAGLGVLMSQGVSEFPLEDPDDPDLLPGYISFIATQPLGDALDEALPRGEITAQSEICLIDTGNEVKPYVAELLSHQGMLAHIARTRQFLPVGYSLLTLSELANLLFGVSDEFLRSRERFRITPQHEQEPIRLRLEALLALHLMLWFGRTLEDCKKLRLAERGARPATVLELIPADETDVAEFRFFAASPDYSAEEPLPRDAVRVSESTISVPDLVGASALVMSLYEGALRTGGAVFSCQVKTLEQEVRVVLSELGGGDPRYTIHKLRSYLHRQIIADSHDVVAATMLSGVPCLSANTPLYYCQYDVNYLRNLYCRSVRKVLEGVYACAGLELEVSTPEVPAVAGTAVGARNCLRLDTVKTNLEALLLVLRKRPRKGPQQLVHWHNCLSLWTVLMFLMATGCRAIRNPLKRANEFESHWGGGALGDKGADDGHMSRLVALPDMLRRQLQAYEVHCGAIVKLLDNHLSGQKAPTGGFFLRLSDEGRVLYDEVRPRTINTLMHQQAGFTPHPVNGFRKLVRTELTERGCPPEILSAFMGHWLQGEEPQDVFSSFCPRAYVQNLHAYLLPLMRELGWMVRNSHLVMRAGA
jgi:hypothetical protein